MDLPKVNTPIRYLARTVEYNGLRYGLSLVSVWNDAGQWRVDISPFERETHSTSYHPGTLRIVQRGGEAPELELLP